LPIAWQVSSLARRKIGGVNDLIHREALAQTAPEQTVWRQRNQEAKVGDLGQLANRRRDREVSARRELPDRVVHMVIEILGIDSALQPRYRVIELAEGRKRHRPDVPATDPQHAPGDLLLQGCLPIRTDEEARTDDRNDVALANLVDQSLPRSFIHIFAPSNHTRRRSLASSRGGALTAVRILDQSDARVNGES